MCGICGRVSFSADNRFDSALLTDQMTGLLQHRGPDDAGTWNDRCAHFGHRRLSIIDLSSTGRQPMSSEDGRKVIVFNGEIYNFREIKKSFSNIPFRFDNDTEVILKLYEKFGTDCLKYLRGMFAFAIWDAEKQRLFFARDRVGKKPFCYSLQNGILIFASELRSLLVNPDFNFEVDEASIFHYLTLQYIPSPRTIFQKVSKLPPAHFGIFEKGELHIERYWELKYETANWRDEEAIERLQELLNESIRYRLVSDVPVGAFLSGGLDSSTVLALMSQFSDRPVKTFTIKFEEKQFSEAHFARQVSERFNSEHQEIVVKPDCIELLPLLVSHYSEPFADSSAIGVYYLSKMTSNSVKVVLSGDGGDELFGGYGRYFFTPPTGQARVRWFGSFLAGIPPNVRYGWRIRRFIDERTLSLPALYLQKICYFNEQERADLLTPEFASRLQNCSTISWFSDYFNRFDGVPFPQNLMSVDTETYLPDDLLVKTDIASMACSLEVRCPFLDHQLMEFAASLPIEFKIHQGSSKVLLKRLMNGKLPDSILNRTKMGFGVPIKVWFRNELLTFVRDILLSRSSLGRGYFRRDILEKLIQRHASGLFDNTSKIYALLMLELWHRLFVDDLRGTLSNFSSARQTASA